MPAIFKRNWQTMIDDDQRLLATFLEPPKICFKRGKNVRETLCQARLPPARMRRQEDGSGGAASHSAGSVPSPS